MDKSTRILNILTLLLKGHVVTQHDLNQFTDVSKKSIRVILIPLTRSFMKMSFGVIVILESFIIINWQDMNLSKTQSKHSLGILSLLIKLQSLTPILHHDIHKFYLAQSVQ